MQARWKSQSFLMYSGVTVHHFCHIPFVRSRLVGPGIPGGLPKKSSVLVTRGNILKMIGRKGMLKLDILDNVKW